ncbi:Uncharacterised protein [Chryseobacterium nakagawai]|nr:Uncharacterised protein [Chryseobacterium nakagawai]
MSSKKHRKAIKDWHQLNSLCTNKNSLKEFAECIERIGRAAEYATSIIKLNFNYH